MMGRHIFNAFVLTASAFQYAISASPEPEFAVHPFQINLSGRVPHMLETIRNTQLPDTEEWPGVGSSQGIALADLKALQNEWVTSFDWAKEEKELNEFEHFIATIEGLQIHFIHAPSKDPNAIPIILMHGWPGSFLEFVPVIDELTRGTTKCTANSSNTSFHVVVPSLPGFAFSSPPPQNWTVEDTTRVFNTLMTQVLGYKTYAVHGTDWGSMMAYRLYGQFNETVRAAHFNFLPFYALHPEELSALNITLTEEENFSEQRFVEWDVNGTAFFQEHSTKPNTIGLGLHDSPVGQLAWIGEKFLAWSDPRQGTPPSLMTHNEILRGISLYYLTQSFHTALYIYAQNIGAFGTTYTKATSDAPLLFSTFKYNVAFWPKQLVEKVGNLVEYTYHDFGGHFPGIDNPPAVINDVRAIGKYWSQ